MFHVRRKKTPRQKNDAPRVARFKQERSQKTYDAILKAAAIVFAKKGFDKAQAPDVARAAGISTGAFYRYFRNKREVFLAMLEIHVDVVRSELAAMLEPARDVRRAPKTLVRGVLDHLFEQVKRHAPLTRVFLAMSLTDRDVAALRKRAEERDQAYFAALLAEAIPRSRLPSPEAAALVVRGSVLAAAIACALGATSVPEAEVKAALERSIQAYLFGK